MIVKSSVMDILIIGMSPQVVVCKLYLVGIPLFRQLYFTSDVDDDLEDGKVNVGHGYSFLFKSGYSLADHLSYSLKRFVAFRGDAAKCLEVMVHVLPDIQFDICPLGLRFVAKRLDHVV